jgi:hypothetical protein
VLIDFKPNVTDAVKLGRRPLQKCLAPFFSDHLCSVSAFVVNSEPEACPSVRLCVGPGLSRCVYVYSAKLIFETICLWRVGIDGRCYEAAPTKVSRVVMRGKKSWRRPAVAFLGRCVAERSILNGFICSVVSYPSQRWRGPPCAYGIKLRHGPLGYRTGQPACA